MKKNIYPSNNLKNLNLIINSDTYKLAHEDVGLLSRNEMRGVRMLLEITKPDLILEENKILSTIIIFGGASITEESKTIKKIKDKFKKPKKVEVTKTKPISIDYGPSQKKDTIFVDVTDQLGLSNVVSVRNYIVDVNGDGLSDFMVGAIDADRSDGTPEVGAAFLFFGIGI